MSDLLHFAEHTLQEVALVFMALVYIMRLFWMFSFKAGKERQAPTGAVDTSRAKGAAYSLANIFLPWAMESTRSKPLMYGQFVLFHLGVIAAIGLSFIIPYAPNILVDLVWLVPIIQAFTGVAFIIGCMRIVRRVSKPVMRAISSPDDYFSLILLTVWFFFAFLSAPNRIDSGETILLTYFVLTAFFLIYVPFSKISHYLYYPFTRYFIGKTLGHRGTYPIRRGPQPSSANNRITEYHLREKNYEQTREIA